MDIGGAMLPPWEIYFADEFSTYENTILSVDAYVQDHPDPGNGFYVVARVYFADGTSIDYPSPRIT